MRLAVEAAGFGAFDADLVNGKRYWSATLKAILGLPPETEVPQGPLEGLAMHFHPDDRERVLRAMAAALDPAGSGVMEDEHRILRPDGEERWVMVKSRTFFEGSGADRRPVRVLGIVVDMTHHRHAEQDLRLSEERFRLLGQATNDVIWDADLRTMRVTYSKAMETTFGYPTEDGQHEIEWWLNHIHPEDRERVLLSTFEALGNPEETAWAEEYRFERCDGTWAAVLDRGYVLRDETSHAVRMIGSMQDISARKQTEESLRRWNERQCLLSEAACFLLEERDPVRMILQIFEKVARHLDLDLYFYFDYEEHANRLILKSWGGADPGELACDCANLEGDQCFCGAAARQRRMIYIPYVDRCEQSKARLFRNLGVRAYVCNPLVAGDRLLGTLAVCSRTRDHFDQGELDFLATLCRYLAIARERVRLEGELQENVGQLAEADRRKDEFLATLAHELRNPLAPIRNAVHILRMAEFKPEVLPRQREIIDRQVTLMARLLDDLLDVSRITRGKIELQRRPVALSEVFGRAQETVRPLIEARRHRLLLAPLPGNLSVHGDPDRLIQILVNLLTNAAKYTDEGGRIELEARRDNGEILISVRDNGMGIAPEMLPRIFDMFTQAHRTLDRAQGGVGIGLTLVRQLVQLHGGSIEARSAGPGRGSEFIVRLPLLSAAEMAA